MKEHSKSGASEAAQGNRTGTQMVGCKPRLKRLEEGPSATEKLLYHHLRWGHVINQQEVVMWAQEQSSGAW